MTEEVVKTAEPEIVDSEKKKSEEKPVVEPMDTQVAADQKPITENSDVKKEEMKEDTETDSAPAIENCATAEAKESARAEYYKAHGGDPAKLDLARCLLVANLPSALVTDSYDVFAETMYEIVTADFGVPRDQLDAIVRIPKLQTDVENQENALRCIVSFKTRVHKHRVFAQKKVGDDSALKVAPIEELSKEWMDVDEELEEVAEDDAQGKKDEPTRAMPHEDYNIEEPEFELKWDGAPEFQWKLVSNKLETKKLVFENVMPCDLVNPFIYRVLVRAEKVEINFPSRYPTHDKTSYGTVSMVFSSENAIMMHATRNLIFVRAAGGRRIKMFLPQTSFAVKQKAEFEGRLGRAMKEVPADWRKLVVKPIPEGLDVDVDAASDWFPSSEVTAVDVETDILGQRTAVVTFAKMEDLVVAHSSTPHVVLGENKDKARIYIFGVETSRQLITRFDRNKLKAEIRKEEEEKKKRTAATNPGSAKKRTAPSSSKDKESASAKKPRTSSSSTTPRGVTTANRGARSGPNTPASRSALPRQPITSTRGGPAGRGAFRGARGGGMHTASPRSAQAPRFGGAGRPMPFGASSFELDNKILAEKREQLALQEQLLRQQQIIDSMQANMRDQSLSRSAFASPLSQSAFSTPYGQSSGFGQGSSGGFRSEPRSSYGSGGGSSSYSRGGNTGYGGGGRYDSGAPRRSGGGYY